MYIIILIFAPDRPFLNKNKNVKGHNAAPHARNAFIVLAKRESRKLIPTA